MINFVAPFSMSGVNQAKDWYAISEYSRISGKRTYPFAKGIGRQERILYLRFA